MSFTVVQISDTHLSAGTCLFRANFDRMAVALDWLRPDLIVHTGDVSMDGADREADLVCAASAHAGLPGAVLCVPGNHDVGDHPERAPRQPVNDARLSRFCGRVGRDRWVHDRKGWRLLGLNSQVMGAHGRADVQAAMITDALQTLGDRRLAVFIHKPFFTADPAETVFDYWSVPPFARGPLGAVMAHPALRLVASGHLHLYRDVMRGLVRYVWAPSVAFVVDPGNQVGLPGERCCGTLLHSFEEDEVTTHLVIPAGMERLSICDMPGAEIPASSDE